jgi:hypothetical protein
MDISTIHLPPQVLLHSPYLLPEQEKLKSLWLVEVDAEKLEAVVLVLSFTKQVYQLQHKHIH